MPPSNGLASFHESSSQGVPVARWAGREYREFDMGTQDLKPGMYFWFAPVNRGKDVPAIYVGRIVLTRGRD